MSEQTQSNSGNTDWLDKHCLIDRYRLFVLAYIETHNGTEAARRAGYKQPEVQAARMLKNDKVRAAIEEGRAQVGEKAMLADQDVAKHWLPMALAAPREQ
ncbi:Terminase small subunit [Sulfitobacter brevis]|uniref:Terminase small subunit n=1 Tax=Sulfitobacter brevis TaxID=74348 RepID=A0A1I2END0_9RHOB|nr:terminase small subunit [Sulfitobacter brevis]SFE94614.1 Terminase small subunit [Sulfitobacter brevis]